MTTRDRFRELLTDAPADAEAIEFEGTWVSWGQLRAVADSLEGALAGAGMPEGIRVGVVLDSRPELVAVLLSLLAHHRCIVTLSPLQPPERLGADIERSELPVLVATAEVLARPGVLEAAGDALVLELTLDGVRPRPYAPRAPRESDSSHGVVVEMLTSGTTGPPKRVRLSERQFDSALATSVPTPPVGKLFRSGVTVMVTPLVHIGGFWGALAPLYAGRRLVLLPRFALEPWVDAVARHRPKAAGLVPAALREIIRAEVPHDRLRSLEVITSGTTYCAPELIDTFIDTYGIRVLPTYGATEFAGAVALWTRPMHEKYWDTKRGSAGRALPGVELRVTGEDGVELPAGEMGLLEIRSAQSPLGQDQWLRTSDRAALDEDGFLWIHGRADDAINRGGFKVHPETIRGALERHPAVHEAAVAAMPDDRLGEVPVAAVLLEPGAEVPSSEQLRDHCRAFLLPYEVPVFVAVLDELPRTPSSKVSRVELLEQVQSRIHDVRA
jgi:long-chain acyl-CoA synthetase